MLILRSMAIWLVIMLLAIINGILRESLLSPLLGDDISLPLSGLSLCCIIFSVAYLFTPYVNVSSMKQPWLVGGLWLCMTLCFEFLFGHFVMGRDWNDILLVFDLLSGNLFLLALLSLFFSPRLSLMLRDYPR